MTQILIVDDDHQLLAMVKNILTTEDGYNVLTVDNGPEALRLVERERIDLMILDVMMPGLDGYELCKRLRRHYAVPIIFLSARDQVADKVHGLHLGGDDYMTKPFDPRELILRVRGILRRAALPRPGPEPETTLTTTAIRLDPLRQVALRGNQVIPLTHLEWRLIHCLMSHGGETVTYDQLVSTVWEDKLPHGSREVMVTIRRLRAKLGDDPDFPKYILTERGVGYRWIGE